MIRTLFILLTSLALNVSAQTIPFGKGHQLTFDNKHGSFTINSKEKSINGVLKGKPVQNEFGKGLQYTIISGDGVQHIIYTYQGLNGFITMAVQPGGARKINVLTAPFQGKGEAIVAPFDNDAWIRYKTAEKDFTSSEVVSFDGLVIGSLEQNVWKTGIAVTNDSLSVIAGWTDSLITRDALPHGFVANGRSPKIAVIMGADGLETYTQLHRKAEPRYISDWKGPKPLGWNSWGSMQDKITPEKIKQVADFFTDSIKTFRSTDGTVYIDLDSYWDKLSTQELKAFADYCRSKKLKAGIYWAPFVDWGKSDRKMEGSDYNYADVWTKTNGHYHDFDGCRALDPTHPATKARIAYRIKQFKECGYEMIKIDFIGHAAIESDHFYDPKVTTGMQAFRQGMEFLSDQLKPMLVYAAISPNVATARYVHMRRIACDAFSSIKDVEYTLNGTSMGWWQQYLYDYIDADHVVFVNESPAVNRARLVSALVTGSIILGDDFSVRTNAQAIVQQFAGNKLLMEAMQRKGHFRPVKNVPGYMFKNDQYVAIINTTAETRQYRVNATVINILGDQVKKKLESIEIPAGDAVLLRYFQ